MAWMNKTSFDIYQTLNDGYDEKDFIEIDDMIAQPISVLNKKGYKTIACCAGHPFPSVYQIDTEIRLNESFDLEHEPDTQNAEPMGHVNVPVKTYKTRFSYIEFEVDIPEDIELPEGWLYDYSERMLYARYTKKQDPYRFFEQQLTKMKALNQWAEDI